MTFTLNESEKFACIAFDNIGVDNALPEASDLGDGVWVLQNPPVTFDETWQKWVGSITTEELIRSNLFLVAKQHSDRPAILDDENQVLLKKVDLLFYGILLQGIPEYAKAYRFTGANIGGKPEVRSLGKVERHDRCVGSARVEVGLTQCQMAKVAADGLKAIEDDQEYKRLKRGMRALIRGIREQYGEDRIHEFVRALEALIKPEIGKTTKQFIHRCQTFALANAANAKILEECYEIRTVVEHMHPFEDSLAAYPAADRNAVGLQRCRQIEALALDAYLRISTSKTHASIFHTDPDIAAFWRNPENQRVALWGTRVDLAAIP